MTIIQSRSSSVSHASQDVKQRARSPASISGASLLGQTGPSLFSDPNDSLSALNHGNSLDDSVQEPPLDIVGALHTLDLEAELNNTDPYESFTDQATNSFESDYPSNANSTLKDPGTERNNQTSSAAPFNGVLSPSENSTKAFGDIRNGFAHRASTPSTTWDEGLFPLSAPQALHPRQEVSKAYESPMSMAPFFLPNGHPDGNISISFGEQHSNSSFGFLPPFNVGETLGAHVPTSNFTPPPDTHELSSFPLGNNDSVSKERTNSDTGENSLMTPKGDLKFGPPELNISPLPTSSSKPLSRGTLWNPAQFSFSHFPVHPMGDQRVSAQFDQFGQIGGISNSNDHWSSFSRYTGLANDAIGSNSAKHLNEHRRHNHYNGISNSGNVHRKIHNSHRRKGEDASKYANARLEDFTGEIFSLCKDQHGCRFLQKQLDMAKASANQREESLGNDVAATMIFNELYLRIVELMMDPFGNYLIQKLFESVSADQRLVLVKNAAPEFARIALDPHGTRALQKLIECVSLPEETRLITENLKPHVVSLSRDLNGNHVVQKCLQRLDNEDNEFIFDAASENCGKIATHRHGCCVLQRCLDFGNSRQKKQLSAKVAEIATGLSLDPFGNYVVQYVLSRGDEKSKAIILDHVSCNIISLSLHKFGSNVIEKSLRISKLTDSMIAVLLKNSKHFPVLLNDSYGNYVLQTSLDVANTEDLKKLATCLQPLLPNIKNTPHGRRIITKIQNVS